MWLSHTIFALPLAVFLLHNFMRELPAELIEAARVDGAGHVTIFFRILLPLLTPGTRSVRHLPVPVGLERPAGLAGVPRWHARRRADHRRVAELSGSRGSAWYLLSAGAFISMIVPVAVFLALQRYFVRGLLAGGLKG